MKTYFTSLKKTVVILSATMFTMLHAATFTATTSGNWSNAATWGGTAPGTNITFDQITIPSGIDVTLDVNVTINGLLSSLDVQGSLMSTTYRRLTITIGTLSGSGDLDLHSIVFNGIGTFTFDGDAVFNHMESDAANVAVACGIDVVDTLMLTSGTMLLNAGSNLTLLTDANVLVDNGSLTIATGIFSASNMYDLTYLGTAKTTGVEAYGSGLRDLHINMDGNTDQVTLGADVTVNGTLHNDIGQVTLGGNELTLKTDYVSPATATIRGSATSDLTIQTAVPLSDDIEFNPAGNALKDLHIEIASGGDFNLASDLTINGRLILDNGSLNIIDNSNLTMGLNSFIDVYDGAIEVTSGNFVGILAYNVTYYNGSHTTDLEVTGAGLNDLELNLNNPTDSVSLDMNVIVNGDLILNYGQINLNGNDLEIQGGFSRQVGGYINGDGNSDLTFNMATGPADTVHFMGQMVVSTLTINIANGDNIKLISDLSVEDLILTNGGIHIYDNDLTVKMNGNITGYSSDNYIMIDGDGELKRYVTASDPYIIYPIGLDSYSPASIKQTEATSGWFGINLEEGVWSEGTSGIDNAATESVVDRTWHITAGAVFAMNLDLRLEWMAGAEVNSFDRGTSYITHYNGTDWDQMVGSNATVSGVLFQQERTGITTLSPFAVVDEDAQVAIEEETADAFSVNVYPNPVTELLNLVVNVPNPEKIEIIDISGKVMYSKVIKNNDVQTIYPIDFVNYIPGIYMVKITTATQEFYKKVIKS